MKVEQEGEIGFMSTSEFDKYKVDHLFLLIGENPLPNYVAARLLLNQGGTLYLVHTTHTAKSATRLAKILGDELIGLKKAELVSLNDYESDAFKIKEAISSPLKINNGKIGLNGTIGLNYTGGTKAMAVHTYRTVFSPDRPDTVFSYLDPRKLEMCIDSDNTPIKPIKIKPEVLPVKLEKLFKIHGLDLKATPTKEAQLPDLAATLAEIFKDEHKVKQWFDWYFNVFCEEARKKKDGKWDDWKSKTKLAALLISVEKLPPEIKSEFKRENLIDSDGKLSLQAVKQKEVFTEIEHFCKYLDGLWLEHHVLQQVKSIANQNYIKDYGLTFKVPLTGTKEGFEFDVAFTRGYQLFAISVSTTSKRDLCKVKLFEAYLRARQMGGDEARVALICCTNEPDGLKAELAVLDDKKIAVFGREDLINLSSKIEAWIKQNDKDAR
ncbi:MAG: DUF1887 family protein [Microcoleus sp. PH2017_15_JOR_U_A]|uniref:DUF1887 domain-containing protein n=1 Tax=unclassified Microcoleus TaxID=2642155 RepID=UPI001DCF720D|nr:MULTISPECIES: DUF1887 domain-containing protein [unclassified Microcoleus]TAG73888.1 MAG: DUF1887 family protein [Oscillatoriales cyanobacterium]MCC3471923.1 DUF1887 family protein [Microcoleus sp. PH2017_13_LAR_U_A]MCC3484468.1 DUF1887 family protein [Microcoleus sp. PH2017_14_LAR_D_A]MCC3497899.1 DUF1887 family protein [Microcoleus sp. PH2017_15_JOR_U_A]MCC3596629.1 DUF1887 family protein [Microcoleus sp. PH2017_26_ELK_O_A]